MLNPNYHELYKNLQHDFNLKNEILENSFLPVSPYEYLDSMFPDEENLVVVFGTLKNKEGKVIEAGTVKRIPKEDIWKIFWRSNAYIPYADFYRNYYSSKTLKAVRAFVVDCDGVSSVNLSKVINYLWNELPAQPTYIVNSGKGVHFVYQLYQPIEVKGLRFTLQRLNENIQDSYTSILEVDKHPLVHPYRFPGFTTKIDTIATAFRVRGPYTLEELLRVFRVKDTPKTDGNAPTSQEKGQGKVIPFPRGKRAFFVWTIKRLFKNPPIPGRRHNSFFALGIIAYKCRREVPKEEALDVVAMIYEDMKRFRLNEGFTIEEAYKAFEKGYNLKAIRTRWKYLCDLLGWEYVPNKRNGRKRKEHVNLMNKIRLAKREFEREELLKKAVELKEKGISLRQISKLLGVSRKTLEKWFKNLE